MFHDIVGPGTTGYLAPEVAAGHGLNSAIRTYLWSCVTDDAGCLREADIPQGRC